MLYYVDGPHFVNALIHGRTLSCLHLLVTVALPRTQVCKGPTFCNEQAGVI